MNDTDVFGRVVAAAIRVFPAADPAAITRETTAADVDGWDSLSHSTLIMSVEEEFGIELPIAEVYELENLGGLSDLVSATLRAGNGEESR